MRRHALVLCGVALLSGGVRADPFDPPPPAGYGADGSLIQMCNETHLINAQRECQARIRYYENEIRDFDRRKARGDTDATARQLQWLRGLQYDLTRYKQACARIADGLRTLRMEPDTRCDSVEPDLKAR
jgi:hypothetical protein